MAVEIGQRLGDYEILSLLGSGGMGRVYRARNVISDRIEAMKILLPGLVAEPELAARFTAEIRTLASLDHPNIAQLRTAFQYEQQLVMIMEFVEGVTLEMRAGQAALSTDDVLSYARQVLAALSYAHARGVIHRDLKPANIMVTTSGVLKLMDFGIAKSSNELQLTRPGTTMGSVYYMSPEQVSGGTVDARSDIYSLGVTLYELLTGRKPFQADTAYSVLNAQLNTAPQPPIELNSSLPPGLNDIILTSLAKDPAARFQTADAFRNALRTLPNATATLNERPAAKPAPAMPVALPASEAAPSPQAHADPQFAPVELSSGTELTQVKSQRTLWIAMGGIAAVLGMIGAATILPHFLSTHATSATVATAPAQVQGTSVPPPSDEAGMPSAQELAPTPPPLPVQTPVSAATTTSVSSKMVPVANHPESSRQGTATKPIQQQPGAEPQKNSPSQTSPTVSSSAALEELSDRITQVSARASAARDSIEQLRRQQEAEGLGLRGDIAGSLNRMNAYLQSANNSLAARDAASAGKNLDRAEKELESLEVFLGKS